MRISDWSSDVCSSDLARRGLYRRADVRAGALEVVHRRPLLSGDGAADLRLCLGSHLCLADGAVAQPVCADGRARDGQFYRSGRSEEHTYELQLLMRISYAVF